LFERLVAAHLRDLAHREVRLGRALVKQGKITEGLKSQRKAAVFFTQTAKENPASPYSQIQMAYTDAQISVALAKSGKDTEALELGNSARAVAGKLTEADPTDVELRGIQAGIYSMFGDLAPVDEIYRMLDTYPQFHFYVDDAHGMSIHGKNGRGSVLNNRRFHPKMVLGTSLKVPLRGLLGLLTS